MIDDVIDVLRCVSDLGSCAGNSGPRWYGRTRPVRILLITQRILRRLCLIPGVVGIVLLEGDTATLGWVLIGIAVGMPIVTLLVEFVLIEKRLMVLGPSSWPPKKGGEA